MSPIPGPRGPSLKVLFCVRSDLRVVPGGDATQILRTRCALEELGVQVTLWSEPAPPPRGSYDLAHLFHLTRLDTLVHARALCREGAPFVLSTIYWPTDELERRGYVGTLRLLHAALSTTPADLAKNAVRALLARGRGWRQAMLPEVRLPLMRRMRFLAESARCLLPNSRAEAEVLRRLGGQRLETVVNATDPAPSTPAPIPPGLPARFILSAGRIEPRKNQLALAQALSGFSLPLVIVGDPGPMHRGYHRRLRAAAGRRTLFLPAQRRESLFGLYAAAEAHVAPAWYETPGLVSLEAAAAGTRVVTTDRGCTREYFGDQACYLDPASPASMRHAVERALSLPRDPELRERVQREYTWRHAGEQTLAAYRGALGSPAQPQPEVTPR
ncbi:MAG: glycosyltransferase family 4 protein [Deltaproteobacteria bacterium]|nr:glycosyltransferase family 4 protein [Deltaproteobacteria bacterium]